MEGIAKSVVNISSHNLASGQTQARFCQIQAARGRKGGRISGAKRYQASNEEAQPWKVEGVSRATWYDRQARAPRESIKKQKPWEAEGVSRRTWYYRKAVALKTGLEAKAG